MVRYMNKNKNELLVLTGAVYSFVAYLTAFTLEVLFIIDLAKQSQTLTTSPGSTTSSTGHQQQASTFSIADDRVSNSAFNQARIALESMQTHLTISCLAISILYFLTFVASLILIISLILRSTFILLVWMCTMATLYLPEFGLIIYVSIYGWGLSTRNGQTELIFYLIRASLNLIFIYQAHRLWKKLNYEKNFFLFSKSPKTKRFSAANYDSPYFIEGDSLSTTINPIFSTSTLQLDRYDHIRDYNNTDYFPNKQQQQQLKQQLKQPTTTTTTNDSSSYEYHQSQRVPPFSTRHSYYDAGRYRANNDINHEFDNILHRQRFYLEPDSTTNSTRNRMSMGNSNQISLNRQNSVLSFNDNDEFAHCELDLDYRTLTQQQHYGQLNAGRNVHNPPNGNCGNSNQAANQFAAPSRESLSCASPAGLSYSTQSLDRRHLKDVELNLPEQVILRPLGHQPFDYLYRPGSSSNLVTATNNLNTQLNQHHSSHSRLTRRDDYL